MTTSRRLPVIEFTDLAEHLAAAPRGVAVLGVDEHGAPVTYDPARAPHLAITTPTGAGRSAALRLVIAQALAHGTRVVLGDIKGSQRWCHDHPNVTVARDGAQAHHALYRAGIDLARRRDNATTGAPAAAPVLVALDDHDTLMGHVTRHRRPHPAGDDATDPVDPAVAALADILYTGRAYGITVASAALAFTAQGLGGHTLYANLMGQYGTRLIGPGTSPVVAELMGADTTTDSAPPAGHRGTFDHLTHETRTRVQVAYIPEAEARAWATH